MRLGFVPLLRISHTKLKNPRRKEKRKENFFFMISPQVELFELLDEMKIPVL